MKRQRKLRKAKTHAENQRFRPWLCLAWQIESMKKQGRETEEEQISDIISSLPDCMLAHILSFLPTKHAILTSILSSRWRVLWTLVPVLHLDKPTLDSIRTSTLNYILFPRNPSTLCKLCIDCPRRSFVDKCVQAAILRGVQELDLVLDLHNQTKELPASVFFCTTLVVLKLRGHFLLNPPDSASSSSSMFPSLKTLQISHVYYANHNSLSTLLPACPLLQDLRIKVSDSDLDFLDKEADNKFNILVLVPTLKILVLDCSFLRWSFKLHINTPALEYFHFKGDLNSDVVSENLPNLFKSVLDVRNCYYLDWMWKLTNFMGLLCNIRSMELWIGTAEYILEHSSSNSHYDVPMFHNLSSLKFYGDFWAMWSPWNAVQLLLCRAPKLQTLTFELNYRCCIRSFSVDFRLKKPLDVPECLSSHLTTCHYKGFSGHVMELVEQILKESKVLKTMKITFNSDLDSKEKLRIHKKIMKFPRTSQTCQIAFD
ncbi:F-box/LRR-repeat protein At4g14103-like isoform X3 [Quercus robur]|uniref:F-box/LRR-repeat protein At4g14103-like isoform X3 n=1 Tax=Quercus robur TaxID=38942 RepID=UPI00216240F8|nr:F-box/LRR-repeat protein At4g14103-like isoform X3 [Quercus robur]